MRGSGSSFSSCIPNLQVLPKESDSVQSKVKAIYSEKSFLTSTADIPPNTPFGLILDRTPFYAESGGQEYDQGSIAIDGVAEFEVENVQVFNGYVVHIGQMKYGRLSVSDDVLSTYDEVRFPLVISPI